MVCFDWEEEERDLCLQNFFWDKKSFDFDLNKRMHALQKLERFCFFFFSFSQFVSKIVFGFSFFKALRERERAALFCDAMRHGCNSGFGCRCECGTWKFFEKVWCGCSGRGAAIKKLLKIFLFIFSIYFYY